MSRLVTALKYLGAGLAGLVGIWLLAVAYPWRAISPPPSTGDLLIRNVHVVDVEHDTVLRNRFVTVSGDTIVSVSDRYPVDTTFLLVIEGRGRYLLPALWDMHVHLNKRFSKSAAAEFVTNGVLHVRDMRGGITDRDPFASTPQRIRRWNAQVATGNLLGPEIHNVPSFAVEGPHAMYDGHPAFFNCSDEAEARRLVDHFRDQGVDLVKTYNNIPREAFFALTEAARRAGMDVAGHKPVRVSTIEAAEAGMKSLEHARFLLWDSYPGAGALRRSADPRSADGTELRERMLSEHDTTLLAANLTAMRQNGTWYCPTLLTRKADAFADDSLFRARYARINPVLRLLSFEDLDATVQRDPSPRGRRVYRDFYEKALEVTATAHDRGVGILAGSDVPELPGSALIDELEELAAAGLSTYEVLRTATIHPARYYGLDEQYGSVRTGMIADLLLVDEDPSRTPSALRSLSGIVYGGRYLDGGYLAATREVVASRNASWVMSAKLGWDIILYMTG